MEHAAHLIKLICMLRPDHLFHTFMPREEIMTQTYLLVRVRGGVLRRARRVWCRPAGRRTSITVLCVTTTPPATTTASGHVRGVRPSSRGASKVRHKNVQYPCMCGGKTGGYSIRNFARRLATLISVSFFVGLSKAFIIISQWVLLLC